MTETPTASSTPSGSTPQPNFADLEPDECDLELNASDLYVRKDGWEFYLGESNGPCRPSVDLDGYYTEIRFFGDDEAVIFHEIPERDESWEISFRVRNVYRTPKGYTGE